MKRLLKYGLGALMIVMAFSCFAACGEPEKHEHTVEQWTSTATCTEAGEESGICSVCHETVTRAAKALGHYWKTIDRIEPTCTKAGKEGRRCERCGEEDTTELEAKGHDLQIKNLVRLVSPATCTAEGKRIIKCAVCNEEIEDVIPKLDHSWETPVEIQAPDCTNPGKESVRCSVCQTEEIHDVKPLGHEWEDFFTIERSATFDHDGLKYQSCTRCNERHNEVTIPKLDANTPTQYQLRAVRNNGDIIKLAGIQYEIIDGSGTSVGKGSFRNGVANIPLKPAEYTVKITPPEGYTAESEYKISWENLVSDITLTASLIGGQPGQNVKYVLGSVLNDLSFNMIETNRQKAQTLLLSQLLERYKIVVLNFWDTSCSFCAYEFPGMEAAYKEFAEDIAIIAIDDPDGMGDVESEKEVRSYIDQRGLSFFVSMDTDGLAQRFNVGAYPTTIIIDREGVVTCVHNGALVNPTNYSDVSYSTNLFKELFKKYTSAPYYIPKEAVTVSDKDRRSKI